MSLLLVLLLGCVERPPPAPIEDTPPDGSEVEDTDPPEPAWPIALDQPWTLQTPNGEGRTIVPGGYLEEVPCPEVGGDALDGDPVALRKVAERALRWRSKLPEARGPGWALLGSVAPGGVDEALRRVARGDALDPERRAEAFRCIAWIPDREAAAKRRVRLDDDEIRLTRYLAWRVEGRTRPSPPFTTALYAIPEDEADLDLQDRDRPELLRNQLTRKQVLDGAYEPGGLAAGRARPLVWLTRDAVLEAMMQGTVIVSLPDGSERTYNVHRHNGRAWNPGFARSPELQERYWYFREVPGVLGYAAEDEHVVESGVIVAGDVPNLGFGVPMMLHWEADGEARGRLVILADTGGAFQPNLFQLDWLVGTFADRAAFEAAASAVPERVRAVFMVPRDG